MTARGIRNNNPGNIVWTGSPIFRGELGSEPEGVFARFDTPEHGIEAIARNLVAYQDRHALNTVDGMIRRWSATDQEAYIANVCRALGVGPKDTIDAHDAITLQRMVTAIIAQENGSQPFSGAQIAVCVANALGQAVPTYAPDTQPAAPIDDRSTTLPKEKPMGAIAIPLLTSLLPSILQMFSGRAQAQIAKATGASPEVAGQFMQSLIAKVGEVSGIPVVDNASAIQAVAAVTAAPDATKIKTLEDTSLDYLHQLTEAAQALTDVRKSEVGTEIESANSAAARTDASAVRERIDRKVWWAYAILAGVLAGVAIAELLITKIVDGQIVGALILAFGAIGGAIITMVNYGYGSSGNSGAKDVLIGEMARRNPQ